MDVLKAVKVCNTIHDNIEKQLPGVTIRAYNIICRICDRQISCSKCALSRGHTRKVTDYVHQLLKLETDNA